MSNAWANVSEYDRFGPWIDQVETLEDMPPLYRDYPVDLDAAQLVIKVPRNIARRDASPDMDLYNHVLILDKDSLTILSRHTGAHTQGSASKSDRGYDTLVLPLSELAAVRDVATLLDGRLTIASSNNESLTVRYNTAARAMVSWLVDQLQVAIRTQPPSTLGEALVASARKGGSGESLSIGRADRLLVSDYLDARRSNPKLRTLASHGHRRVKPGGEGMGAALQRGVHTLVPMTVHGAVFSTDGTALEVFGRKAWLVRGKSSDHSSARMVMPLGALDSINVRPHDTYPDVAVVTLHADDWSTEMAIPDDSEAHRLFREAMEKK